MVRRIVTAQRDGFGVVTDDTDAPSVDRGVARVHEVWIGPGTDGTLRNSEDWELNPPAGGSIFRLVEFAADDDVATHMHSTPTIDYGVIVEGTLTLLLDGGEEVELQAGDTFIQRQANHAWVNRSGARCVMAVVLVDGEL